MNDAWREKYAPVMEKVLAMAQLPNGFTTNDLMLAANLKHSVAHRILTDMVEQKKIKRTKTGHRSVIYESIVKPKHQASVYVPPPKKLDPNAPLIITPQTKITICPSPSSGQFHKSQFANW